MQAKRTLAKQTLLFLRTDLDAKIAAKQVGNEFGGDPTIAYIVCFNLMMKLMGE